MEDAHPEVAAKGGKLVVLMRNGGDASTPLRGDVLHPSTLAPQMQPLTPQLQQQIQQQQQPMPQQQQNLTPDFNAEDSMGEYDEDDDEMMQQTPQGPDGRLHGRLLIALRRR